MDLKQRVPPGARVRRPRTVLQPKTRSGRGMDGGITAALEPSSLG